MNKALHTDNAPAAIGPYSPAVQAEKTIYVSGQLPVDPATGEFAGEDISDVTKTTVLLQDIADFGAMNEVYAEFFTEPYPARAAFQVAALPKGAKVEIEAVAVISEK